MERQSKFWIGQAVKIQPTATSRPLHGNVSHVSYNDGLMEHLYNIDLPSGDCGVAWEHDLLDITDARRVPTIATKGE